ncbi:MAG: hypothetical protein KTR15_01345 [Phycisphaeraceae bacterium]|nr:hypothetical protein [Phycisphaeraceae bacterium]
MRILVSLTAFALLLTLAACQKVNLRGPALQPGETIVSTVESETEPGNMKVTVQGQAIQGQMQTSATNVIEQTILEVEDGQPTKVQMKFVVAKTVSKSTMNGQANEQEDTSLQGAVITQTKTADGWETQLEGSTLPPETRDIIKNAGYADQRLVFPDKPIGVGDKWEIEDELIQSFMGQTGIPGAKFEGDMSFEMIDLKKEDGQLIAVLDFRMDGTITMSMSPEPTSTMNMTITMKGGGTIYRNLTNYTTAQHFEGEMDMTMDMTTGGQPAMKMTTSMPMKVNQTQERK